MFRFQICNFGSSGSTNGRHPSTDPCRAEQCRGWFAMWTLRPAPCLSYPRARLRLNRRSSEHIPASWPGRRGALCFHEHFFSAHGSVNHTNCPGLRPSAQMARVQHWQLIPTRICQGTKLLKPLVNCLLIALLLLRTGEQHCSRTVRTCAVSQHQSFSLL